MASDLLKWGENGPRGLSNPGAMAPYLQRRFRA